MSKAKKTNKYEPIYTFETKVPLRKLLKSSALINFAPFLILFIFSINGYIDAKHALGLASSIFILSLLFIYPYIADLQDLTEYVRKLNRDNNSKRPELSFINNVEELSSEIEILNKKWQQKNLSLKKNLNKEKETQQLLQDFVANASHEMKTPLSSIKGFAETIASIGKKTADEKKFLGIIGEQSQRLEDLINELLVLAKLEDGKYNQNKEVINFEQQHVKKNVFTFFNR